MLKSVSLTPSSNPLQGLDAESIKHSCVNHLEFSLAKDEYSATLRDNFKSFAYAVRDRLIERWIETQQTYYNKNTKRVYYLSLEFLVGRTLYNAAVNLGLEKEIAKASAELGCKLEDLVEIEADPGLGNGGLGRLAACFLDSMATLELPAYGYGIRYDYGIFFQRFVNGWQVETPDSWLRYGNPWEIERPEYLYPVRFYGRVHHYTDADGKYIAEWRDTDLVMAMAYDTPVPGYRNNTVNNMRLWSAKSSRDFQLDYFNHGDYERAVADKVSSETISKVLYPNDNIFEGRELRLKQEYFFVSATIQDIIRRYKKQCGSDFSSFPEKVAIQLNDTHPAIAIAELMRVFVDEERLEWDAAWEATAKSVAYTNHTILPEALEKWSVDLFGRILPRHLEIIHEINSRFLDEVRAKYPNAGDKVSRMSIIEEGDTKRVCMANLAIIGSHSVNGVSALHSNILKNELFHDFCEMLPERFNNKTNGITQRRWLLGCNPALSQVISDRIGDGWAKDLYELAKLVPLADDPDLQKKWRSAKKTNKERLAGYIEKTTGIGIKPDSLIDCQVKRLHEYKRQLLNCLHVITLYQRIKEHPESTAIPRTVIFSGKAAPGYHTAKLIIKLINSVAEVVNSDPDTSHLLKVVFLPNYGVTLAEIIIAAADLSEQISTAGTEASGTGNMKFALNGALTIGTLDGANVEIREEVGAKNIFIFGMTAQEVAEKQWSGYEPWQLYESDPQLKQAVDAIAGGYFSPSERGLFRPLTEALLRGDPYMLFADYRQYIDCQADVEKAYKNARRWTRMSILNTAKMGKFSSDRTIAEYATDIWGVEPVSVELGASARATVKIP